jgi:hypothetical protein
MHEARIDPSSAGHGVPITMACMLTLATFQKLISEESSRREQIRQHLEAALELLMMSSVVSGSAAVAAPEVMPEPKTEAQPTPPRTPERRHYMEKIVALLTTANRPMSPAELRDEIRKQLPATTREALERAVWLELRKDKPRLARLGEGKYGLPEWRYRWITDGALQGK